MVSYQNIYPSPAILRSFEAVPSTPKTLLWDGDTPHLSYCDMPEVLDYTATSIDQWAASH